MLLFLSYNARLIEQSRYFMEIQQVCLEVTLFDLRVIQSRFLSYILIYDKEQWWNLFDLKRYAEPGQPMYDMEKKASNFAYTENDK